VFVIVIESYKNVSANSASFIRGTRTHYTLSQLSENIQPHKQNN